jgi:hypothetical protein
MGMKVKKEVNMSNKKHSSASRGTDTKTKAYRNRFEKNYVKARNPWPDPFASSGQSQSQQTHNQKTTVRASDNSQQSRSKSDNQHKTGN